MAVNFTPLIEIMAGVVTLIPSLVDMIINLIPAQIAMAFSAFLIGIFGAILAGMR